MAAIEVGINKRKTMHPLLLFKFVELLLEFRLELESSLFTKTTSSPSCSGLNGGKLPG